MQSQGGDELRQEMHPSMATVGHRPLFRAVLTKVTQEDPGLAMESLLRQDVAA
jgi:hypothetical protein